MKSRKPLHTASIVNYLFKCRFFQNYYYYQAKTLGQNYAKREIWNFTIDKHDFDQTITFHLFYCYPLQIRYIESTSKLILISIHMKSDSWIRISPTNFSSEKQASSDFLISASRSILFYRFYIGYLLREYS